MPRPDLRFDRLVDEGDLDAVAALEARCFTNPWTRELLARELAQSDVAYVFLARTPDAPLVGFCSCWIIADELHINTMAVDEPFRGQGIGTQLMRYVMEEAARRGAIRATLEVRASNLPARRLYESLGFGITAVRPKYYTNPEEDALILWRNPLAGSAIRKVGGPNPES